MNIFQQIFGDGGIEPFAEAEQLGLGPQVEAMPLEAMPLPPAPQQYQLRHPMPRPLATAPRPQQPSTIAPRYGTPPPNPRPQGGAISTPPDRFSNRGLGEEIVAGLRDFSAGIYDETVGRAERSARERDEEFRAGAPAQTFAERVAQNLRQPSAPAPSPGNRVGQSLPAAPSTAPVRIEGDLSRGQPTRSNGDRANRGPSATADIPPAPNRTRRGVRGRSGGGRGGGGGGGFVGAGQTGVGLDTIGAPVRIRTRGGRSRVPGIEAAERAAARRARTAPAPPVRADSTLPPGANVYITVGGGQRLLSNPEDRIADLQSRGVAYTLVPSGANAYLLQVPSEGQPRN